MGYLHIDNLYKSQDILIFKKCYALNKIHGTSAHIAFKDGQIRFFSCGEKHENFVKLFDATALEERFREVGKSVTVYGEAYGGKQQGMSATYGPVLRFVAFDVCIGEDGWMTVPRAEAFVKSLGLDFVDYVESSTDLAELDKLRDSDCPQAIRNGMGAGHKREGLVLRPLVELRKNNGSRIICKHKRDDFRETKNTRAVSPEELKVLTDAQAIADEWVTEMRITHVLDKIENQDITNMGNMIKAVLEDVKREGEGEITWSTQAEKNVMTAAAKMIKRRITKVSNV